MEILQQLFPGKITNCQMNIHYACISRLLHIHSLEATGEVTSACISKIRCCQVYIPQFLRSDEWMQRDVMDYLTTHNLIVFY